MPDLAAHDGAGRLRRRHLCRARTGQRSRRARRRRTSRASGCGASWPSARWFAPGPSSGRSCSATTTGPASCWREPCALTSIASAWRRDAAPSSSPTMTTRSARRPISPRPESKSRPWSMGGEPHHAQRKRQPRRPVPDTSPMPRSSACAGATASKASRSGTRAAPAKSRLRPHRHVRRLEPGASSHHPSQRQAAVEREPRGARPGHLAAGDERRRRGQGHVRARGVSRRRRRSRRRGRVRMRLQRLRLRAPALPRKAPRQARCGRSRRARARPSSISRTT